MFSGLFVRPRGGGGAMVPGPFWGGGTPGPWSLILSEGGTPVRHVAGEGVPQ